MPALTMRNCTGSLEFRDNPDGGELFLKVNTNPLQAEGTTTTGGMA